MGTGDAAMEAAVRRVIIHPDFEKRFKHPVKFNGTDFVETRLSAEQQFAEVAKVAAGKLHVFLERYGDLLSTEDLRTFANAPAADTAEARFWLERLRAVPASAAVKQKQGRRRRWLWAQQEMARQGGFFSEDEMKHRDPTLFHKLVGRHLEPTVRLSAPMQGSLSTYLMQRLEQECDTVEATAPAGVRTTTSSSAAVASGAGAPEGGGGGGGGYGSGGSPPEATRARSRTPPAEQDEEIRDAHSPKAGKHARMPDEDSDDLDAMSDDDMSDIDGDVRFAAAGAAGEGAAPDDVTVRRAKFLKAMRDRFVNGAEPDFDYSAIDANENLDDIVELGRDAEEKYFDNDGDDDDL